MEFTSYYKMLRGASSYINLLERGTRLSGSIATKLVEDNTPGLARSDHVDSAPSVQRGGKDDCSSREEHNRTPWVKTSSPSIHVEKNLLPLYVLNIYLEDAILKRFSDHNKLSTKNETSPVVHVLQGTSSKPEYSSTTTALEFREMMSQLDNMERSTSPSCVSRTNTDDKEVKNGGLLPFVTKLPTFRQQGPPQAGFASTAEEKTSGKQSSDIETVPVMKDTATKLGKGITDAKGTPVVEGSVQDGSFSNVTRVNIFNVDPNSVGLASTVKGLSAESSTGKRYAMLKASTKVDATINAASRELESAKEFLKYQTVPLTVRPETKVDRRAEAEMKACAVVTQNGSLRDARTLIEFSKSRHAPRSLMNLKEGLESQYNDHKTLALLQKYKLLKLREIDYHHAQIKKHRKQLLELMFKTPYQAPQEQDPSKPP